MVECEFYRGRNNLGLLSSFNRYMVECEFIGCSCGCSGCWVLIDTWWNVNLLAVLVVVPVVGVLIDTWWNVNDVNDGDKLSADSF